MNDEVFDCVTSLGPLIRPGNVVLGYDLVATVGGDWVMEESFHSNFMMPYVVLVEKSQGQPEQAVDDERKPKIFKALERGRTHIGRIVGTGTPAKTHHNVILSRGEVFLSRIKPEMPSNRKRRLLREHSSSDWTLMDCNGKVLSRNVNAVCTGNSSIHVEPHT